MKPIGDQHEVGGHLELAAGDRLEGARRAAGDLARRTGAERDRSPSSPIT